MKLRVELNQFKMQVQWLIQDNWIIRPVEEMLHKPTRQKEVAISFDDGYHDQLAAAKYLRSRCLYGTFFLIPGVIGRSMGGVNYYQKWPLLTQKNWEELVQQGHEIGAHSYRHPGPLTLEPSAYMKEEVQLSFQAIRQMGGANRIGFSYPHGAHSPTVCQQVEESGFDYACDSRPGSISAETRPFLLPRIEISGHDSLQDFRDKVEGRGELWRILRHDLMRKIWKIQGRV